MYRYIGNKTSVLTPLIEIIINGSHSKTVFYDAMCGTASVGNALTQKGFRVISSDIMQLNTNTAEVRTRISKAPRFSNLGRSYLEVVDYLNGLKPKAGYFSREYSEGGNPKNFSKSRLYLSKENGMKLDAIRSQITMWNHEDLLSRDEIAILRHNVVLAVNRIANIAGTYGHFRSSLSQASLKPLTLTPVNFNQLANKTNKVYLGRAEELSSRLKFDYIYIDPPYKKRQYAANYHLLETIVRGDNPPPSGASGLRDWWPQYSDFCSKRKISLAFDSILKNGNFEKAYISYSEDGLISIRQLTEILALYGRVTAHKFQNRRFKSNQGGKGGLLSEFVFEVVPA